MRPCPFCAEQIQPSATLCRFCDRQVFPATATSSGGRAIGDNAKSVVAIVAVILVGLMVFAGLGIFDGATASAANISDELRNPSGEQPPLVLEIGPTDPVDISAGHYEFFEFEVEEARECTVAGRILGLAGGSKDFNVFIFDKDGFHNFRNSSQGGHVLYQSPRTSAHTFERSLPSPGSYVLVVSNTFSAFISKTVQLEQVRVTCY